MTNITGTPVKGQAVTAAEPSGFVKEIIAILGSGLFVVLTALSSGGHVTPYVVISAILAAITVVPVAWVGQAWWGKAIAAGVIAALQLLLGLLAPTLGWGHVSDVNWASVILAFITAAGVGIIPNKQTSGSVTTVDGVTSVGTLPSGSIVTPPTS